MVQFGRLKDDKCHKYVFVCVCVCVCQVGRLRKNVDRMKMADTINLKTVKETLRHLKNGVESCKSIPKDFQGKSAVCVPLIYYINYEEVSGHSEEKCALYPAK